MKLYTTHRTPTILSIIRNSKWTKVLCFLLAVEIFTGNLLGQQMFALTSGPSQPEATNFQPAGVTDLVDPFSGDFSYNIPIMEIGGYPINLSYASGISMDQEATWTGLGWNLNTGAIVRNMRGLPDDFNGDEVVKEYNVKENKTYGVNVGLGVELFGGGLGIAYGIEASYNNYTGYSIAQSFNPSIGAAAGAAGNLNFGLGLTSSSSAGLTISPSVSFSARLQSKDNTNINGGIGIGLPMNSRSGLGSLTLNGSLSSSQSATYTNKKGQTVNDSRSIGSANLVGASLSFATPSYTPMIQHPMINEAQTFNGMIGVGIVGADLDIKAGGYLSGQKLAQKVTNHHSYGYIYSESGQNSEHALQDFNREKDGGYSPKTTTKLPLTNYSYDVFQIQAQGLGGSIRPFRNEASYIHDNTAISPSVSGSIGFELSVTQLIDGGVNASITDVRTESGLWTHDNLANANMPFNRAKYNVLNEKVHFRMAGEKTVDSDSTYYANTGGDKAVRFDINQLSLNRKLISSAGTQLPFSSSISRSNRQNRVSSVECLTVSEVKSLFPQRAKKYLTNSSAYAKGHHIAQITVVKPDGTRYVFGLPAYNLKQQEITFACGEGMEGPGLTPDGSNNVTYPNSANGIGNKMGIDHSYDKTTLPAYIHTWYLTEILSPDYVDVTGDGPSEDDIGNYTVFEYGNESGNGVNTPDIPNYKWRTPTAVGNNKAAYNKNLKTDPTDDRANIIYGEKQVWYVHKIKSKTQVCVFTLSDREDGFGVNSVNQGVHPGLNPLKKIDKISLYAKEDWENYESDPGSYPVPVPVKEAHFNYTYELCDNIPNNINGNGKLTLKAVWFTFEKSGRARYSPYKFEYSNVNPNYDVRAVDRWGNYRPYSLAFPNEDIPYVDPNRTNTDAYAEAWSLKKITLPSGGNITVDYESDDYAYVQDRLACRMFQVIGAEPTAGATYPFDNKLFAPNTNSDDMYLYFRLADVITAPTSGDAAQIVKNKYFVGNPQQHNGPTKFLYFRFLINVGDSPTEQEYVSGYAEIDLSQISVSKTTGLASDEYDVGVVKLVGVRKADSGPYNFNPIAKSTWQFSRMQTPTLAFNQTPPTDDSFEGVMNTMANASFINTLTELFQGVNGRLRNAGIGCYFDNNKSFIRLLEPDGIKLGGGHRVKSVEISDNWAQMTNNKEGAFSYGQEYDYTNADGTSSGVAAWEPAMGADENPFRMPIFMDKEVLGAPDERFYIEEPLGECFFPGPSVGYSKVTVRSKQHANVTVNATGHAVHEFYTAKDFPTKVDLTQLVYNRDKSPFSFTFLVSLSFDKIAATQGYCIINNDMHGKPKIESIYDQAGTLISQTQYEYQQTQNGELDNYAKVVEPDGKIKNKLIGVDYDFIADMRQMKTNTSGAGMQINAGAFLAGFIPLIIPTLFPDITKEETLFRSATVTKTVFKTGLLKRTTVFDKGAIVKTENIAYDGRTGEVLVTKVNNEYNKERYAVSYPAHWAYDGMGFAASNWGYVFRIPADNNTSNTAIDTATRQLQTAYGPNANLVPGDELMPMIWRYKIPLYPNSNTSNSHKLWVAADSLGNKYLIDKDGNAFLPSGTTDDLFFKVVRSGRRNMGTMGMGSAEVLENPLAGNYLEIDDLKILNTSAQEFSEHWRTKIFRTNVQTYASLTCGASAQSSKLIILLNQLIDNNKFVRNVGSGPVASYLDVSLTYGDYNITGLLPSIDGECEYYYTSLATGYDPPFLWMGDIGLDDNAYMNLSFTPKQDDCVDCSEYAIVSLSPQSEFEIADFNDIAYFSTVITINDYLQLTGADPYLYMFDYPDNVFISRALMQDGSYRDFLFFSNCPGVIESQANCCTVEESYNCLLDTVNPYLYGLLGNWRPVKSHTYLTNRQQASLSSPIDRRVDGYFTMNDGYFWKRPTSPGEKWGKTLVNSGTGWRWAWTAEITNYNNAGGEVENVNPLNIFSSAVYGYKQTLPIIVAQNAKYKEIGFDGFEDYTPLTHANLSCVKEHFKVATSYWLNVSEEDAHTGRFSYLYNSADSAPVFRYNTSPAQVRRETPGVPYILRHDDKLTTFSPDDGTEKKYLFSFWIKQNDQMFANLVANYFDSGGFEGIVKIDGIPIAFDNAKYSPNIDGWQQVEYEFTMPNTTASIIEITFNGSGEYFIDDVRVHPFDALAKSFVYNSRNLRFMAELDENNYATYYEYDEDGALVRVKKETERGILTLKENRNRSFKTNP